VSTDASPAGASQPSRERILAVLRQYWGYDDLRPHQEAAIRASLGRRDSLLVLPTGGGKSLCFQIPAAMRAGADIVVSPLISLMQDQVDGLRTCAYPAVALNSGATPKQLAEAESKIRSGEARLIYAAPERLFSPRTLDLLASVRINSIVVDEAHCISHWGHDFRPEYRRLTELRRRFPGASWHAFTATATRRVRDDIVHQLGLRDPEILVGDCDRPNLIYRVAPRTSARAQLLEALRRHEDQAAIVYCISRKDTERTAEWLASQGLSAAPYHAGLSPERRRRIQDDFMRERLHVVVATVAFGMGVDRSDVRCVVHMAMPKSIEHYQQEAGRAGRDGLDAECVLLYSSADPEKWRQLMLRSASESGADEVPAHQLELLGHMQDFCARMRCRHAALAEYFGQSLSSDNCGACDVCLGENEVVEDATVISQKIISAVARLEGRFGAAHVVDVLTGAARQRIRSLGHDRLSVFGILAGTPAPVLRSFIDQLIDARALARADGEFPLIRLTPDSRDFLKGERDVTLLRPRTATRTRAARPSREASWEGVDPDLFDRLRALRREIAEERGVPAYIVFGDQVLRDLARVRPADHSQMLEVKGIGPRKLEEFGDAFLECMRNEASATGD